jgi:hypothetical protein
MKKWNLWPLFIPFLAILSWAGIWLMLEVIRVIIENQIVRAQ